MMKTKGSGTIGTIVSVLSFGFISSGIISFFFNEFVSTGSTQFSIETLFENMTVNNVDDINIYWIILLSWAVGGLVGGVRAKNPSVGSLGGFFGAFIGALLAILIFLTGDLTAMLLDPNIPIDFDPIIEPLPGFAIGAIGAIFIATIFGYGAGKVSQEKSVKKRPKGRISKTWQDKKRWKCSNCGRDLPPGAMKCPNCGRGVIQ